MKHVSYVTIVLIKGASVDYDNKIVFFTKPNLQRMSETRQTDYSVYSEYLLLCIYLNNVVTKTVIVTWISVWIVRIPKKTVERYIRYKKLPKIKKKLVGGASWSPRTEFFVIIIVYFYWSLDTHTQYNEYMYIQYIIFFYNILVGEHMRMGSRGCWRPSCSELTGTNQC